MLPNWIGATINEPLEPLGFLSRGPRRPISSASDCPASLKAVSLAAVVENEGTCTGSRHPDAEASNVCIVVNAVTLQRRCQRLHALIGQLCRHARTPLVSARCPPPFALLASHTV